MKTTSPTLHLVQLSQPNKEGLYPIVLRAHWHGFAEKRTGVAIPKAAWNPKSGTIKTNYPNAGKLNKIIHDAYKIALARKLSLEESGLPFIVNDIFQDQIVENKLDVCWLIEQMINERNLSYSSARTIRTTVSKLQQYIQEKPLLLTKLNSDCIQAWGRHLSDEGRQNGTIINYMYTVCNIWNYAISKKYVAASLNPFEFFNPRKVYKEDIKKRAITTKEYDIIKKELDKRLHKQQSMDKFIDNTSEEFALAMYILGYTFGGLAFADMAELKKDQLTVDKIEGKECYVFNNVRRKKTNHPVPIIVKKEGCTEKLLEFYRSFKGEYLFPIYDTRYQLDDENKFKDVARIGRFVNDRLKRITGLKITYYSCRHSFATHYVTKPGASPIYLASMMGRSINGIWRYVQDVYSNEDLIRERSRMGL